MIKTESLVKIKEDPLMTRGLITLNTENKEFKMLMDLYEKASKNILENLYMIKDYFKEIYNYDIISNITYRIKSEDSIINKMKKKKCELTYKNLIDNINDIAGIRVVCTFKNDITKIKNIVRNIPNTRIIKEKDYIKKPKKSGYTGYHIILETLVEYEQEQLPIKVEIQLRSMAMDFWSATEHRINYKPIKKLSSRDTKKLQLYAKIINTIDEKIMKIYKKQYANK